MLPATGSDLQRATYQRGFDYIDARIVTRYSSQRASESPAIREGWPAFVPKSLASSAGFKIAQLPAARPAPTTNLACACVGDWYRREGHQFSSTYYCCIVFSESPPLISSVRRGHCRCGHRLPPLLSLHISHSLARLVSREHRNSLSRMAVAWRVLKLLFLLYTWAVPFSSTNMSFKLDGKLPRTPVEAVWLSLQGCCVACIPVSSIPHWHKTC